MLTSLPTLALAIGLFIEPAHAEQVQWCRVSERSSNVICYNKKRDCERQASTREYWHCVARIE